MSAFAGNGVNIEWRDDLNKSCAELGGGGDPANFTVSANVLATCTVSATTLDFGNVGIIDSNVDSTNSIDVNCVNGTPYTVGLDGGLSGATDPTQRKMNLGAAQVTYGIYRDAARTQPWGDVIGTNTVSGTGTGLAQSYIG